MEFPWITELRGRESGRCEGFSWNRVSGRRPRGHPANACPFRARWHYEAMPPNESADLCTHHIFSHGLMMDYPDIDRWEQWWKEHNHD